MPSAVIARHISRNFQHGASGTRESFIDEITVTVSGTRAEIDTVTRIDVDGVRVEIDPVRRLAMHRDHCDPAIPFEYEGEWHLQVFLWEVDIHTVRPRVRTRVGGADMSLPVVIREENLGDGLSSSIERVDGRWFVVIEAPGGAELIWQGSRWGRETESEPKAVMGRAHIEVPGSFSERHGLCISTDDPFGGTEHKHMIFGEAGHASGRIVAMKGRLLMPKLREQFAYRAAIVVDDLEDPDWAARIVSGERFDEVDIWCRPERAELLGHLARRHTNGKVTTYAPAEASEARHADVVTLDRADAEHPGKPISFLLFTDQADGSFPDRLARAVAAVRRLPTDLDIVERAWLGDMRDVLSADHLHYGIGFSTSSDGSSRRTVELMKRLKLPSRSACVGCRKMRQCDAIIATPWASAAAPSEGRCAIRKALS